MNLYIGLEGVEGAGKTSVASALADLLVGEGQDAVVVREPGGTDLGEEIRRLLLHSQDMTPWAEAALFAAQRAQLVAQVVRPALEAGAWVISDRTFYSSLAYQGGARGLGIEQVRSLNLAVLDGVVPDLVVVMDVDPSTGLERQQTADRIGGEGIEFQRRVRGAYQDLAEAEPERVRWLDPGATPQVTARLVRAMAGEVADETADRS